VHDLACVIHLHSLHSDGTGTVREIARAARRAGVDVVLLTDHDTLAARECGEEGWQEGVLVLVGEEVTPAQSNHTLAFGARHEIPHRGRSGEEICAAIRDAGGLAIAAHPFSKGSERFERAGDGIPHHGLGSDALTGIELWSFVTDTVEAVRSIPEGLRFAATPNRVLDHPPLRNMRGWDRLCRERRVVAIGGLDAHQVGKRIGPVVLRLMGYRRSFAQLRTHVLLEEPLSGELPRDEELVYGALRDGRCYLAVDALAPARGFGFDAEAIGGSGAASSGEGSPGERREVRMGAEAAAGDYLLRVRSPRPARLRLLRDGEEIAAAYGTALERRVEEPGVYRAEAALYAHGRGRTWVITNPVYLRG
jgi:hypothetical protein